MRSFSLGGSLVAVLLAGAAAPAFANTTATDTSAPPAAHAQTLVADEFSPVGMQERSRHSDADSNDASPDDADDDSDSDDSDGGTFADRGSDLSPPDSDNGPDDRGYRTAPDSDANGDGPEKGYEDGDRDSQSDEDDDDSESDDDSGFNWA